MNPSRHFFAVITVAVIVSCKFVDFVFNLSVPGVLRGRYFAFFSTDEKGISCMKQQEKVRETGAAG